VQVLAEELEAPGGPEDGYSTDSSLSERCECLDRQSRTWTVVGVAAVDVNKTSTTLPTPQFSSV